MEYWQEVFVELEDTQFNKLVDYLDELDKEYNVAIENIKNDLATWYALYGDEHGLTMEEARRELTVKELSDFKITIAEYKEHDVSEAWLLVLAALLLRVRVSRYDALKYKIYHHIEVLKATELRILNKLGKDIYVDNYYQTVYQLQVGTKLFKEISSLKLDSVNKLINKPWAIDNINFTDRVIFDKNNLKNLSDTILFQSMVRGAKFKATLGELVKKFNLNRTQAKRLIKTETAFFRSLSTLSAMNENGIKKYELVAVLDHRTSKICRLMDGKIFLLKDYKIGVTAPPFHPNCRTVVVPIVDGMTSARNSLADVELTFERWKQKYMI